MWIRIKVISRGDEMTIEELDKKYKQLHKQISRLYSSYTPVREIEELYRLLEIARQNELKKILEKSE